MQQAVVNQRLRAQFLSAARLTPVANADHQRVALPLKILAANFAAIRFQGVHPHQTVDQIRHSAQRRF